MAPVVSHGPKNSCRNFPLCTKSQTKQRNPDGSRSRIPHCASCSDRPRCLFPDCENHTAPSAGRYRTDFCAVHYHDPCNATFRKWVLCSNSRIGCSHLSQTPRAGKCFACESDCLPCAHSLSGCLVHVRNPPNTSLRLRAICSSHKSQRCPFDPDNKLSCSSSLCGRPRVSSDESRCHDCLNGHLPCSLTCSRRLMKASDLSCALCSHQVSPPAAASSAHHALPAMLSLECARPATRDNSDASAPITSPAVADCEYTPQQGFQPACSCFNFPICVNSQRRPGLPRRQNLSSARLRSPYCNTCELNAANGRACSHPLCIHPAAPATKSRDSHGFCRMHVADPGHASVREWPLCRNSEDAVFSLLDHDDLSSFYTKIMADCSPALHHAGSSPQASILVHVVGNQLCAGKMVALCCSSTVFIA